MPMLRKEHADATGRENPTALATLTALAEPNRLHIVELLQDGPLSVGEIALRLELKQPQTSKHLRVLLDAGLLDVATQGNRRIYGLEPEPFQALADWVGRIEHSMASRFNKLDTYLETLQAQHGLAEQQVGEHAEEHAAEPTEG